MTDSPLGCPVQIAYAVTDLDSATRTFAESTGAGPFFVAEHIPLEHARVNGVVGSFDHSSAYGQWGDVMVELVVEHTPPLVTPTHGVHHMAFMVDDLAAATSWCFGRGWPEILFARTASGQEFAFCDARDDLGHLVELYEPTERLVAFYEMVARAAHRNASHQGAIWAAKRDE